MFIPAYSRLRFGNVLLMAFGCWFEAGWMGMRKSTHFALTVFASSGREVGGKANRTVKCNSHEEFLFLFHGYALHIFFCNQAVLAGN